MLEPCSLASTGVKMSSNAGDNWLDDDPLSEEQKALLEARLKDTELHPESSIPWAEAKRRLHERFMK